MELLCIRHPARKCKEQQSSFLDFHKNLESFGKNDLKIQNTIVQFFHYKTSMTKKKKEKKTQEKITAPILLKQFSIILVQHTYYKKWKFIIIYVCI